VTHCLLQNTSCCHWHSIQVILTSHFLPLIFKSRLGDHWNRAIIFCAVVDSVSFMFFSVFFFFLLELKCYKLTTPVSWLRIIFFSFHLAIVIHRLQGRKLYFSNDASRKNTKAWSINSLSEFLHSNFNKNTTGIKGVTWRITLKEEGEVGDKIDHGY